MEFAWLSRLFEPFPRSDVLRLPWHQREADRVRRDYDRQNGRYFLVADVVLDSGEFLRDVMFHGDANIAVELADHDSIPAEYFGRPIRAHLIVLDCHTGTLTFEATEAERDAFRRQHAG